MLTFLKLSRRCRVVLAEKTDRLYRNLKDWVTIDGFGLEPHLVKEILTPRLPLLREVHARHTRADGEELHRTMGVEDDRGTEADRARHSTYDLNTKLTWLASQTESARQGSSLCQPKRPQLRSECADFERS